MCFVRGEGVAHVKDGPDSVMSFPTLVALTGGWDSAQVKPALTHKGAGSRKSGLGEQN